MIVLEECATHPWGFRNTEKTIRQALERKEEVTELIIKKFLQQGMLKEVLLCQQY